MSDAERLPRPAAIDVGDLPDDDGRLFLSNNSTAAHLFENCPHLYHSDPIVATPSTLDEVWSDEVARRGSVTTVRWCTDCQHRLRGEGDS